MTKRLDLTALSSIEELERALFSDPWSRDSIRSHLASPYGFAFGIQGEKGLTAYGLFTLIGEVGEVLRLGTGRGFEQKGHATEILRAFQTLAEKAGADRLFLEVRRQNQKAVRLYEKEGFVLVGTRKNYYQNPRDDALLYEKKLERSKIHEDFSL